MMKDGSIKCYQNNRSKQRVNRIYFGVILTCTLIVFSWVDAIAGIDQVVGPIGSTNVVISGLFPVSGNEVPIKFDDFEQGVVGDNLNTGGWLTGESNHPNPTDSPPIYIDTKAYSGAKSGYADITTGGDCATFLNNLNTETMYVSLMFYCEIYEDPDTTKGVRVHADNHSNIYTSYPSIKVQDFDKGHRITIEQGGEAGVSDQTVYIEDLPRSSIAWMRLEYWFKASTPGITNGKVQYWKDLLLRKDSTLMTRISSVGTNYDLVMLPFYAGNGGGAEFYYDDVYISKSLARVEIGDKEQWSQCSKRSIQQVTSWGQNSIIINSNFSGFVDAVNAFLWVVDANGNVIGRNSEGDGYLVVIDNGIVGGAPEAPVNLTVSE